MSNMTYATATVELKVKVTVSGTWGENCTIGQVKQQALDSMRGHVNAINKLAGMLVVSEPQIGHIEIRD